MKTTQETQNYLQEQFVLEKRKLHMEYMEKLNELNASHSTFPESREMVDKWLEDESKILSAKYLLKEKTEKISDSFTSAGNKLFETFGPFINMVKTAIEEEFEDLSSSELETFWNHEARDVFYLETVKNQIEKEQFEKELQAFKSKKCKIIPSCEYSTNQKLIQ
eukprot:gene2324-2792_t